MSGLRALGLSAPQEGAYLALVDGPPVTVPELGSRLPADLARDLERTVAELVELGLVSRNGDRLAPVPPDAALGPLILRCEESLSRARGAAADLVRLFHRARLRPDPDEPIEVIAGADALRDALIWLQRRARHEVRVLDVPPYVEDPYLVPYEREILERGVTYRIVYDDAALLVPARLDHLGTLARLGERARVAAGLPTKLLLVDDAYGLAPLRDGAEAESAVLVRPSILLTALTTLFELLWSRGVPVTSSDGAAREAPEPSAEQRRLLGLLAAGFTDERIATALGVSARTFNRRVNALMDALGVATRFQLGAEARRRGWL